MNISLSALRQFALPALVLICVPAATQAADRQRPPLNVYGAPVLDEHGQLITYTREQLAALAASAPSAVDKVEKVDSQAKAAPEALVPAPAGEQPPFWQYSIFGSAIGASNIVIGPAPAADRAPEIIIGGNSQSHFGAADFWHVIRHNSATGQYDQVFVSPIYTSANSSAAIKRIALGNVTGDDKLEIVVMLEDGRIYLYDFATKAALGHVATGKTSLQGLSVTDLTGDGRAELIVSSNTDLYVFDAAGLLLWEVAGAGGFDVVVGQMDPDPALEIASTSGKVVDAASRVVQWTRQGGFGARVRLAPIPGESYQQLVAAESWYYIYSYDVARQLPRWSIRSSLDIASLRIADVDNDGTPEVLYGDAQGGLLHVHDLLTQAKKWQVGTRESGVTDIAVRDVDADGVVDLLWGAGWTSTGSDYFYVAKTTGDRGIKWQSLDLVGPFLGPLIGDLDGDGQSELVVCTYKSESGYSSGRVLVFDLATRSLRATSAPVIQDRAWTGIHDFKLRDVDSDGRMDIVLAADHLYDGTIEIYGFSSSNAFTLKWTNTTRPSGSPFNFVEVADLNGNGTPEIIAGNTVAHTGSEGVYIHIYDYPSTTRSWRSVNMGSGFSSVGGLVVDDFDGNGSKEIAALTSGGDLYTFDGPTRELQNLQQQTGGTLLASRRDAPGLILADSAGVGHFLSYAATRYAEEFTRQLGPTRLDGLNLLPNGDLWTGNGGRLYLRLPPAYGGVRWQSPLFGTGFGRFVATDVRDRQNRVFSSTRHAVAGFTYRPSEPAPATLGNISTRLRVGTADNVLIGGFIVTGTQPKKVIVRAIGPSLPVDGRLANPILELRDGDGVLLKSNDNWASSPERQAIIDAGVAPTHDMESAIVATLPANRSAYTAIVRGVNAGTGVGLVEVFDLDQNVDSKLANISTRGFVQTGSDVMIGGIIVLGERPAQVIVRAIGPSLPVDGRLNDPFLELRDREGNLLKSNDNWVDSPDKQAIIDSGVPPADDRESAIIATLPANVSAYTAIVSGVSDTTGVALVEAYALD